MATWVLTRAILRRLEDHVYRNWDEESCGIMLFHEQVSQRIVFGENRSKRYMRGFQFTLDVNPVTLARWWKLNEQEDYELAVWHSHPSPARPSFTDWDEIGDWQGKLYLIFSMSDFEIAAYRIYPDHIDLERLVGEAPTKL